MPLPTEARSHHTVWVSDGGRSVAVRYAVDGDELVCFGDDGLARVPAGTKVTAKLRGLHCGALTSTFAATVREIDPSEVGLGLLAEVVGHRQLGATVEEAERTLEGIRTTRRLVALHP